VELPDSLNALAAHVGALLRDSEAPISDGFSLRISLYGAEDRIGWEETYIVTLDGYGVVGFVDWPGLDRGVEELEKSKADRRTEYLS
jgi:hypothetical protein